MPKGFIKVWKELDTDDVAKHLCLVSLSTASCANCGKFGLDYSAVKACPGCNSEFKYISFRINPDEKSQEGILVRKIIQMRPDLTLISYDDYQRLVNKAKAKDLFK